jgi:LPXTG-motif cell wall-anchored protein
MYVLPEDVWVLKQRQRSGDYANNLSSYGKSDSSTPTPSTNPKPTDPDIPIDTDNDVPLGGIPPITKPETLPKTGESSHLYVEIAGITLILLGLILRRRFTR